MLWGGGDSYSGTERSYDEKEPTDYSALDVIKNPETRQKVKDGYDRSKLVYKKYLGIDIPDLWAFEMEGVDYAKFGREIEDMEAQGLEPIVSFNPVLRIEEVKRLLNGIAADKTIPGNPLEYGGICISDEVTVYSSEIYQSELDFIKGNPDIHPVTEYGGRTFTVSAMHGAAKPNEIGNTWVENKGKHPTLSTYLTAQAARIVNGEQPFDASTWTWATNNFVRDYEYLRAVNANWFTGAGQLNVYGSSVVERNWDLGARSTIYG